MSCPLIWVAQERLQMECLPNTGFASIIRKDVRRGPVYATFYVHPVDVKAPFDPQVSPHWMLGHVKRLSRAEYHVLPVPRKLGSPSAPFAHSYCGTWYSLLVLQDSGPLLCRMNIVVFKLYDAWLSLKCDLPTRIMILKLKYT